MKLPQFLIKHGITQRQLAKSLGCHPQSIGAIMRGIRYPSYELAAKIEAYTNGAVSAMEMLERPQKKTCPYCKRQMSYELSAKTKKG